MEFSNYIMTRPKPPQDLDVRPSEEKIVVSWKPPVETPENNTIKYYNVYVRVCSEDNKCTDSKLPQIFLTKYFANGIILSQKKLPEACVAFPRSYPEVSKEDLTLNFTCSWRSNLIHRSSVSPTLCMSTRLLCL